MEAMGTDIQGTTKRSANGRKESECEPEAGAEPTCKAAKHGVSQEFKSVKCLICSTAINPGFPIPSVLEEIAPSTLLSQLFDILKISSSVRRFILAEKSLPAVAYCTSCQQNISYCLKLIQQIADLQNALEQQTEKIKEDLVGSYSIQSESYSGVNRKEHDDDRSTVSDNNHIRKTLVQCWANCQVKIGRIPASKVQTQDNDNSNFAKTPEINEELVQGHFPGPVHPEIVSSEKEDEYEGLTPNNVIEESWDASSVSSIAVSGNMETDPLELIQNTVYGDTHPVPVHTQLFTFDAEADSQSQGLQSSKRDKLNLRKKLKTPLKSLPLKPIKRQKQNIPIRSKLVCPAPISVGTLTSCVIVNEQLQIQSPQGQKQNKKSTLGSSGSTKQSNCKTCGKYYQRTEDLQRHEKLHLQGYKGVTFKCPKCPGVNFRSISALCLHRSLCHKIGALKSFHCTYCQNVFRSTDYGTEDENSQGQDAEILCSHCSKYFANFYWFSHHHEETCTEKLSLIEKDKTNDRGKEGIIKTYAAETVMEDEINGEIASCVECCEIHRTSLHARHQIIVYEKFPETIRGEDGNIISFQCVYCSKELAHGIGINPDTESPENEEKSTLRKSLRPRSQRKPETIQIDDDGDASVTETGSVNTPGEEPQPELGRSIKVSDSNDPQSRESRQNFSSKVPRIKAPKRKRIRNQKKRIVVVELACTVCEGVSFKSQLLLDHHYMSVHNTRLDRKKDSGAPLESFKCTYCDKIYKSETFKLDSGSDKLKIHCDQTGCDKIFSSFLIFSYHHDRTCSEKPELIKEDQTTNTNQVKQGVIRSYGSKPKAASTDVPSNASENALYLSSPQCKICQLPFKYLSLLEEHMLQAHLNSVSCPECPQVFPNASAANFHQLRNHGVAKKTTNDENGDLNSFQCVYCDEEFNRDSFLVDDNSTDPPGKKLRFRVHTDEGWKTLLSFKLFYLYHRRTCISRPKVIVPVEGGSSDSGRATTDESVQNATSENISDTTEKRVPREFEYKYKCDICNQRFKRLHAFSDHQKMHRGEFDHHCTKCEKKFTSLPLLHAHYRQFHRMKVKTPYTTHTCGICKKSYNLKYVETDTGTNGGIRCSFDDCEHVAPDPKIYRAHHDRHHRATIKTSRRQYFKCKFCNKDYRYTDVMSVKESGEVTLKCTFDDKCQKVFKSMTGLKNHHKIHHNIRGVRLVKFDPETHVCKICHKVFKRPQSVEEHMITAHTKEFKIFCEICGMGHPSLGRLKTHMRNHTQEKSFKCDQCPKTFPTEVKLEYHLNVHNGVRPFVCEFCGKGFPGTHHLYIHQSNSHKEEMKAVKEKAFVL